ncbi:MAG: nuclear transport factor 2 family protein [Bacteroidetes bacterium]|nr:nuclear transport factor 2 family protein [Bacteroidota bacterium]
MLIKHILAVPIILGGVACDAIQTNHQKAEHQRAGHQKAAHPKAAHPNGENGVEVPQNLAIKASLTLDRYHRAAAEVRFDDYFGMMTDSAVFVGTDAGEHWRKSAFMEYARPHFDKGKAWTMRAVERHLHFSVDSQFVWFEELLDTRMKLCRGSGVMSRHGQDWLIEQYVLSPTVPNSLMKEVIDTKRHYDDSLLNQIINKNNIK